MLWRLSTGFGSRLRVSPWQGDHTVALIGPQRTGRAPRPQDIRRCLDQLGRFGVDRAVTPALSYAEAEAFYQAGFGLFERLHLLSCRLVSPRRHPTPPSPNPPSSLGTGRPWHDNAVLEVDARAFRGFWRFDKLALKEAKAATPARRFRVARVEGEIVGYAVTGRAGERGYLQRLAVDPRAQGRGIGAQLVRDSFDWLRHRGVTESLVNTQETNVGALALYERLGYQRQREGLVVLRWPGAG
jgi:ribosomal protein S18 acetylase RimI-like enzyme